MVVNYEESIKKSFTDFGKLIIGIILSIIPIVNWIAQGFIIESSGIGKNKPSKNMPEWKNISDYFIKGLLSYVIILIYSIPAILVLSVSIGYLVGSLIPAFTGILPAGFMSSVMTGQIAREEIRQLVSQNWMLILPTIIRVFPLILLGLFLLLVATYLSPIAILNYLKNRKFGKAFDLKSVAKKAFTGQYFIAWIVAGLITIVLRTILAFIPFVGPAIAYFVSGVIAYSLFGQVYRETK
jgi:hypothetical protein